MPVRKESGMKILEPLNETSESAYNAKQPIIDDSQNDSTTTQVNESSINYSALCYTTGMTSNTINTAISVITCNTSNMKDCKVREGVMLYDFTIDTAVKGGMIKII
jgi:hypothetical protein